MEKETMPAGGAAESANGPHAAPYGLYVLIWVSLLILTQFTVMAGQMHLGLLSTVIAVIVTPLKALLVLFFFMHLRYEKAVFAGMLVIAIFTLTAALCLTFADYSFR